MAIRTVHFVGIGGVGMSWLARLLLAEGWQVTGSDTSQSPLVQKLQAEGATVSIGHDVANVPPAAALVVYTAAARDTNPELVEARRLGIRTIKRAEYLGEIMQSRHSVAIAGTHGKTTTSAMTGIALAHAGLDPTVMVGGEVPEFGSTLRLGKSDLLVVEADEFDASFLRFNPAIAVVTNVEAEHLDFYGSFARVIETFWQFLGSVPEDGHIIVCADDPVLAGLVGGAWSALPDGAPMPRPSLRTRSVTSYGFAEGSGWRAVDLSPNQSGGFDFVVLRNGQPAGAFALSVPGRHNVSNTLAAIAVAGALGVDVASLAPVLNAFQGVNRRFQVLDDVGGVTVIDDYGHHPTEARVTLAAARARYGNRRIWCVFQPHTYSRTKLLLPEFRDAFADADKLTVTEIYAAREDPVWGITGSDLVATLNHQDVAFAASVAEAAAQVVEGVRPGDVVIAMGAGDIYTASQRILAALRHPHGA
ncbi:MAG: UDP-N-acetylmuramate--L-alanine ligase [Dehalococcoidia bacterium]|nr:UDP-N-acetylmuramate--L-alanine ligase [Dehalococcoidia bacterium]